LGGEGRYKRFQKPMQAARVCEAGNTCVSPRGRAVTFKDGLLTVELSSGASAANMQMESAGILECINKKLGQDLVKKLKYKIV
jgi:predicted nucleic acid-binding Zn ribbon protein